MYISIQLELYWKWSLENKKKKKIYEALFRDLSRYFNNLAYNRFHCIAKYF